MYLPYRQVDGITRKHIAWWWQHHHMPDNFQQHDDWEARYKYIPTRQMMLQTLTSTVKTLLLEEHPGYQDFDAVTIMNSCLQPNTEWKLNIYKNLRNDYNSHNSGVVNVGDSVLVELKTPHQIVYQAFKLCHV